MREVDSEIYLTEDLFLGKGAHKATYAHPTEPGLCIKIPFEESDEDIRKEMLYRRLGGKQVENMSVINGYYGTVSTNKGKGYLFERIRDYDGNECRTLAWHMQNKDSMNEETLLNLLLDFKQHFLKEMCVLSEVGLQNCLVQRLSSEKSRVVIIDGFGAGARVPFLYFSNVMLRKRAFKYWRIFVHKILYEYPSVITQVIAGKLLRGVPSMKICVLGEHNEEIQGCGWCGEHLRQLSALGNSAEVIKVKNGFFGCLQGIVSVLVRHPYTEAFYVIGTPRMAVLPLIFAKVFHKPVALLLSDEDVKRGTVWGSGIFGKCECYIVSSEERRRELAERSGIEEKRIVVLNCSGDIRGAIKVQFWLHNMFC